MRSAAVGQIYLVGFMGAGKTTVGRALGTLLAWGFADLDDLICQRLGKNIPDIFRDHGEPLFRMEEHSVLVSLTRVPNLVVATGGGTYVSEENRSLIEAAGWSVWLRVSLAEALRRCGGSPGRPLLGSSAEAEGLFRYRQEFYRCARTEVDTESTPPTQVAERILEGLLAAGFEHR